jgi:uncharacterized membrane protein YbhN (UPF0104 family)
MAMSVISKIVSSRVVKYGFVVVTIGAGIYALSTQWTDIHNDLAKIGLPMALAALACVLGALFAALMSWRALLAGLGSPLPVATAARIVCVGQLGKYVPGSVWPVLAQMEIASAHKVPRTRTGLASVLSMLTALLTGLIVTAIVLPFSSGSTPYEWTLIVAPFLLVCLYPKILNWGFAKLLKLARRPPLEQPLGARALGICLGWSFASWLCYGLQIWVLAIQLGAPEGRALPLAIGAFAFAWSAGFVVILAPAGAGVRDVIMIAMLHPPLTLGSAAAVSLVSRAVTLVADVITAGVATAYYRRDKKRTSLPSGQQAATPDPLSQNDSGHPARAAQSAGPAGPQ